MSRKGLVDGRTKYPQIIIFHEKHGDRYYLANSDDEFYGAFLEVFVQRYTEGYWFTEEDIKEYQAELDTFNTDGERAHFFLMMRNDAEYEGIECEYPRVVRDDEVNLIEIRVETNLLRR